ncbi:MAG: anthranilate synthase component I family protein, partial [Parvularculaceae bacterium]|nr:anthranilate synthase component I family protein [Parvularculaceae bacterium]
LDAFAPLADEPHAILLHAGEAASDPGWSVLVAFPTTTLAVREGATEIDGSRVAVEPLDALRALLAARRGASLRPSGAPFATGLVGHIGYEMGAAIEPTARGPQSPYAFADMEFGAYDAAALFDRKARRAFIVGRSPAVMARLGEALGRRAAPPPSPIASRLAGAEAGGRRHQAAVAEAIERIRAGDFFQANLAQTLAFESATPIDAFAVFRRLSESDAPFGAYLRRREGAVLSASPERFFALRPEFGGTRLLAEPIKGTRARGPSPDIDRAAAESLLASAKDRAENIMIVDLTRNDLARVCRDGSITEPEICGLRSFSTVHHLVSTVSGVLRPDCDFVDALTALFPCGSITGAPKVEAMKAIAALEGRGRGPYCGAIGWIGDDGAADLSVAIRTILIEGSRAFAPVGGGVTLRSEPSAELEETLDKAKTARVALGEAS